MFKLNTRNYGFLFLLSSSFIVISIYYYRAIILPPPFKKRALISYKTQYLLSSYLSSSQSSVSIYRTQYTKLRSSLGKSEYSLQNYYNIYKAFFNNNREQLVLLLSYLTYLTLYYNYYYTFYILRITSTSYLGLLLTFLRPGLGFSYPSRGLFRSFYS